MSSSLISCSSVVSTPVARSNRASTRGLAARQRVAVSLSPRPVQVSLKGGRAGAKVLAMADDGKPKITRDNEKEAWLSEMEREGKNPFKDPMAMVAIGGISVPFIILAIAAASGYLGQ